MNTKSDTIAEIMRLNPTVGATFLCEFSNIELLRYLQRLKALREPSGPKRAVGLRGPGAAVSQSRAG